MSDEASAPFSDAEVAKDTLFDLLSSPRRRFILYYLHEEASGTTLQDLADQVGAWEYDKAPEDLTRQERKRVYVSLYQTHIPKLAESGIIRYDDESGAIELTDHIDEFGPYLGWQDRSQPWQAIYLGVAIVSLVFYGLVALDVGPFGLLTEVAAGLAVAGTFVLVAVWQYVSTRRSAVQMPDELIDEQ